MRRVKRWLWIICSVYLSVGLFLQGIGQAADWRQQYPEITLGVITAENEADRLARYQLVHAYLERVLDVKIKWRTTTNYAGIIEGVKARKIELARLARPPMPSVGRSPASVHAVARVVGPYAVSIIHHDIPLFAPSPVWRGKVGGRGGIS